jgi:hypothetical protein
MPEWDTPMSYFDEVADIGFMLDAASEDPWRGYSTVAYLSREKVT